LSKEGQQRGEREGGVIRRKGGELLQTGQVVQSEYLCWENWKIRTMGGNKKGTKATLVIGRSQGQGVAGARGIRGMHLYAMLLSQ